MAAVTLVCPNKECPQFAAVMVKENIAQLDPASAAPYVPMTAQVTCTACASEMQPAPVVPIL